LPDDVAVVSKLPVPLLPQFQATLAQGLRPVSLADAVIETGKHLVDASVMSNK
jgi:hypothetical protein